MPVRGIRGAITAAENTENGILTAGSQRSGKRLVYSNP